MQQRIHWVDVLRGIGIFLIALSHQSSLLKVYLFSFHVPLFFFFSGFVFSPRRNPTLGPYVKKRLRTIVVPYFLFSFLTWPFWAFIGRHYGHDAHYQVSIYKPILGAFFGNGYARWMLHNIPLWFLPCLFVTGLLFFLLYRGVKTQKWLIPALVAFSVLGYLDSLYMPIRLPWGFDVALTAIVFYGAGFLLKQSLPAEVNLGRARGFLLLAIFLGLSVLFYQLNGRADMNTNRYGNYFYFYGAAFGGIGMCTVASILIRHNRLLEYLGRNSLIILAWHSMGSSFAKAPAHFLFKIPIADTHDSLLWALLFATGSMLFCVPAVYVINRWFPWIIGRSQSKPPAASG